MIKKEQNKEKPEVQEQKPEQNQEQQGQEPKPEEQPKEEPKPEEQPKEQPKEEKAKEQPKGGKKPAKESDGDTAKRLMEEHGVEEIHKAGSYWFKKKDDAEAWAKQQGCKVESFGKE